MQPSAQTDFEHLNQLLAAGGVDPVLHWLEQEFRQHKRYSELFEVLKMQARRQVGFPLSGTDDESPGEPAAQEKLERLLYQACGRVGEMLFRDGRAALAWKYFQLVGDRRRAAQLLRDIPANEENVQELIDVALGQGVALDYGIELTLRFLGTCSAITSLEQLVPFAKDFERNDCADKLVRHVYGELALSVGAEIESREGRRPTSGSLMEWIESRAWLFADGGFQVDPSHLVATVQLGRMTTGQAGLEQAISLCRYGQRLSPSLIGPGESPFVNVFVAHQMYFEAALGRNVEQTLSYFRKQLPVAPAAHAEGRSTAAVIVDLLCRNQRWADALSWSLDWLDGTAGNSGVVPEASEIARQSGQLPSLAQWYRQRGNLLMYGVTLMAAGGNENLVTRNETPESLDEKG